MFYLTNQGSCGWQGKMQELEVYQELKASNHPSKMLAIAEHWLRKELDEQRRKGKFERAQRDHNIDPTDRQGGFASGRNIPLSEMEKTTSATTTQKRQGRLSDIMGNAGVLDKHNSTPTTSTT